MTRIEPGTPMPTFRVRGVSGEELSIGELIVGNWCGLSRQALPALQQISVHIESSPGRLSLSGN